MVSSQNQAYAYGLAAVLLWSTVATAFKLALRYLTPLQLVALSSLTSTIVLLLLLTAQKKFHLPWRYIREKPLFYLTLGLINPLGYYLILFKAYDLLPAQQAQPLNYTWAITLSLLAIPLLGHKLQRYDWAAMLLGYVGVVVIATGGDLISLHFSSPLGVALALLSTLLWAGYWLLNQRHQGDPIAGLCAAFLLSVPWTLLLLLFSGSSIHWQWQALAGGIYIGCFEMGLTFACWMMALKKTEKTARVSNLIFISPFLSLFFIAHLLEESIVPATYVGLILIIGGLLIQQYGNHRTQQN
ncbi:DMT family transporter [Celerinatantimonas sp. YJH-8]|uniref:DMT family transporter n=1 Tax=Celerinatantimonas sp. YJH-8 TaxID=3228714 RepID=UPI0038C96703